MSVREPQFRTCGNSAYVCVCVYVHTCIYVCRRCLHLWCVVIVIMGIVCMCGLGIVSVIYVYL